MFIRTTLKPISAAVIDGRWLDIMMHLLSVSYVRWILMENLGIITNNRQTTQLFWATFTC